MASAAFFVGLMREQSYVNRKSRFDFYLLASLRVTHYELGFGDAPPASARACFLNLPLRS